MGRKRKDTIHYVGEPRWRSIGTSFGGEAISFDEALMRAGADYGVVKRPVMAVLSESEAVEVPGNFATLRDDTWEALGMVKSSYECVGNREGFAVAKVLCDEGSATLDAIGVLAGGSRAWCTVKLGDSIVNRLDGSADAVERYAFFSVDHAGKGSVKASLIGNRVRCNNMLPAIFRGVRSEFKLAHKGDVLARVEEAHRLLLEMTASNESITAEFNRLAAKRMTPREFRSFAEGLLDFAKGSHKPVAGEREARESEAARTATVDELESYFRGGLGNTGESAWDAFNSVTEWIDHKLDGVAISAENRSRFERAAASNFFGKDGRTKREALKRLRA